MRRSACFLTIVGLSLNSVAAQDLFGPSAVQPKPAGRSLQYFNSGQNKTQEQTQSQRSAGLKQAPQPVTISPAAQTPNYYSELFGDKAELSNAESTESRSRLKPVITPQNSSTTFAPQGVVQAAFEEDKEAASSQIEQVRAEGREARPFPGASPVETPSSFAPVAPVAPRVPVANPNLANPSDAVSGQKTSLTTPIAVESTSPAMRAQAGETAPANRGNVTFSQRFTKAPLAEPVPTVTTIEASGPQTPSVTIEWKQQSAINVGQECQCDLVVKNSGKTDASSVEVEAFFPNNVRLLDANPKPSKSETFLGWQFATLKAGEERTIKIKMLPLERGNIATRANVRFTGTASNVFTVAEPLLAVKVQGPQQVMIGESAPHTVVVTNPGNGIASNVQIEAVIPDGLEHARGKRLLMEIGSLNPGESRSIRLAMAAVTGGEHQIQVQARADAGLIQRSVAEVSVIAPSLNATIDGPGLRYLGRRGVFSLTVANDGAAATSNVQLMHKVPAGFEFISADKGVQFDKSTRLLTWFVGRLEKGEQSELNVTLSAKTLGEHKHLVRATSEHGSLADAEFTTRIEGTSSLSVEVVDLDDPVETGTEAIYEVRLKNEGSAAAKDVGLACEMATGVSFVGATGPTQHIAEQQNIVFRTIPELGPGKVAVYRVRVTSQTSGNARFRARVTSESVEEALTADELTKFYGE
ncbi:DUF11 domain-containing protein [Thalassoglobus polymorphus]|uniref:Large cysteine-rich periplasmic protein OmcB n=1 Tax=Thalassoglobus polymorphus TaxID=2527994 RepID=A0A517QJX1_9PLAN|nr:DUF11 domain-containing protein [Thalassoglobus polymorphus]QDT31905.1 Large cysteine-rich periplasmic protein OmcB [Thalassoglobus polymorphus]